MMHKGMIKAWAGVVILGLSTSVALAQGQHTKMTVTCPDIGSKGSDNVINYGTYLAGVGSLKVNSGTATRPLFEGPIVPGANIPVNLSASGYNNHGVSYMPANGSVTCYYQSTMGFAPFSISYMMNNAFGGVVTSSDSTEIHISIPLGVK
jgi:hypothetical protein